MDAFSYIEQIPMWSKNKHSLAEVKDFLREMGDPQERFPAIHIAGTNGKGSVCAFLTSILREAGCWTGTFVSPHLEDVRERFLLDGQMAGREDLNQSFRRVYETAKRLQERGKDHPSYFEFLFYMAMELFARRKVEAAVIETGLGGRLDATNALEAPVACAITSIGLDHTQYLGATIGQIAWEKAGIIKPFIPVVYDASEPQAAARIRERAGELSAPAIPVSREDYRLLDESSDGGFWISDKEGKRLFIPFEAPYQAANAMVAVKTARILRKRGFSITEEAIRRGIAQARWPGRMERAGEGFYLDGAHNPAGAAAFEQAAFEILKRTGKEAFLLFGAMEDKDYREMARILCKRIPWKEVGFVCCGGKRGALIQSLKEAFSQVREERMLEFSSAAQAIVCMEERRGGDLVFCAGSLYLTGEFRKALREKE